MKGALAAERLRGTRAGFMTIKGNFREGMSLAILRSIYIWSIGCQNGKIKRGVDEAGREACE